MARRNYTDEFRRQAVDLYRSRPGAIGDLTAGKILAEGRDEVRAPVDAEDMRLRVVKRGLRVAGSVPAGRAALVKEVLSSRAGLAAPSILPRLSSWLVRWPGRPRRDPAGVAPSGRTAVRWRRPVALLRPARSAGRGEWRAPAGGGLALAPPAAESQGNRFAARRLGPGRTSEDHEHTSNRIWCLTCGEVE
jgi:hypothetical protein